ncbi:tetratricopeptide repeat protein [Geitlerinema sp. P-1104]|uniref:sulfotransferase domain-containing protein n=1 Tax=Geitlerinema sp. P-1104 TaxID=2546230 RepID=UPI001477714D|nr:sulfotransferase domain-containing protein [Geitlerinema sp. P-1104]NMG57473.1 tetratricopeptide repeat protein [Geitlerinema sp. P-1104]
MDNPEIFQHLADCYRQQGHHQQAIAYYHRSLQDQSNLNTDSASLHRQWGDWLMSIQEWDRAIEAYERSLRIDPDNFSAFYQQAACFSRLGDRAAMVQLYLKSIPLNPDFPWYYYPLFWQSVKHENKIDAAISQFKITLNQCPQSLDVYINLGDALSLNNQTQAAISYYQKGVKLMYSQSAKIPLEPTSDKSQTLQVETSPTTASLSFLILGVQKAGTSSLYAYLSQHPQILPPLRKELEFWSWKFYQGLDWYFSQFPHLGANEYYRTGEACPNYFDFPNSPERLARYCPTTKFIILLRNPVDRAISHYHHWRKIHQEPLPLEEALEMNLKNLSPNAPYAGVPKNYLERGLYADHLRRWFSHFPREQFLILKSEHFYDNPDGTLKHVYDFLELPHQSLLHYPKYNTGAYPPCDTKIRDILREFYKPHNQDLNELLGEVFF